MTLYFIAFLCFITGFVLRRTWSRAEKLSEITNTLVVSIIMPIVVLSTIPDLDISIQSGFVVLIPWFTFFAPLPLSLFVARKFQLPKPELIALIILCGLGNTAFLGIGMVKSTFGEAFVPSAVLYDQLGSFLLVATVVSILVAMYADRGTHVVRPSFKSIIIKVLCFPPFTSLIIALFIPSTDFYGQNINQLFDLVSITIVPLALFIIGLQIKLRIEKKLRIPLIYLLSMKLVLVPSLVLFLAFTTGIQNPEFSTIVFQSAMPPMVTPAIMLIQAKIAPKLVASALGIGTVLSFFTLFIWANLITKIIL